MAEKEGEQKQSDVAKEPESGIDQKALDAAVVDTKTPAEKELTRKNKEWDKARQESDQKHAKERKDLEAKLETQTVEANKSRDQIKALEKQMSDAKKLIEAAGKTKPGAKPDELKVDWDVIDPDLRPVIEGLNAKIAALSTDKSGGAEILAQLKSLQGRLDKADSRYEKIADDIALNAFLDRMDGEYGQEYRNEAVQGAKRVAIEQGFTDDNPPSDKLLMAQIEIEYVKLKMAGSRKPPVKEADESSLAMDDGGGGVDLGDRQFESAGEVAAAMKADGKADGLTW